MPRPAEAAPAIIYKEGEDLILDGAEFDPGGDVQAVYSQTTILTNEQIKALPNTAASVNLAPAPGAGKMLQFISAIGLLTIETGGAYTNLPGGTAQTLVIVLGPPEDPNYQTLVAAPFSESDSGALGSSGETWILMFPPYGTTVGMSPPTVTAQRVGTTAFHGNTGLTLTSYNSGVFTGGHANNTLKMTVFYSIIDL